MEAVTHLEKVIVGEVSAVTHLEKVIAGETSAVTYTEKVITGEAPPITHLQRVIAGVESPVTHLEYVWAGRTPEPTEHEYTGVVPYSFNADGTPLLDWYIKGNTVQNGTPTPDNPVMPNGTGERTGNLFDINTVGIENGTFNPSTGATSPNDKRCRTTNFISLGLGTYTLATNSSIRYVLYVYDTSENYVRAESITAWVSDTLTFTLNNDRRIKFGFSKVNDAVITPSEVKNIMLNIGSTALPYEPYGIKISISSANTTTPVYLGEVETTRKIKKLVLTGEETVAGSAVTGGWIVTQLSDSINNTAGVQTAYCSHYLSKNNGSMSSLSQGEMCISTQANNRINFVTTFATAEDFKSYLTAQYAAGTPVTVWYVLATEETAVVNEPLMKIGDYADEVSNVATIPTNNGSTTIDVDTTVKPSEIYIKYKGV